MSKSLIQDFSNLPRIGNTNQIKWADTPGMKIQFSLDGEHGNYEIISHRMENKQSILTIKYNNKIGDFSGYNIRTGNLVTFIRGHIFYRKQYNIGDIVKCGKSKLAILDISIRKKMNSGKQEYVPYYYVHCLKCGARYWKSGKSFDKTGCACCYGDMVITGINDVATTNPEMEQYFAEEDKWMMYSFSAGMGQKFYPICPSCGRQSKKLYSINDVRIKGFSCMCSKDGKSYGEKYVGELLNQLNI